MSTDWLNNSNILFLSKPTTELSKVKSMQSNTGYFRHQIENHTK